MIKSATKMPLIESGTRQGQEIAPIQSQSMEDLVLEILQTFLNQKTLSALQVTFQAFSNKHKARSPIIVSGNWTNWTNWTDCNSVMNSNYSWVRSRSRNCSNPGPMYGGSCPGNNSELFEKESELCPTSKVESILNKKCHTS